jgi:hypothetical protein
VDKASWNSLLLFAAVSIPVLSLGTLVRARPRRQVFAPFLPSLVVSIMIYATKGGGASAFHTAFIVCSLLALGFALFLIVFQPERDRLATFSWALLGVTTPYAVVLTLIAAACWGQTECFG